MLETGYRISDLNRIPVTDATGAQKNKIAIDETYMLAYANTVYGIRYNRNNYKIPLTSIRDDIKGYIGIESITAPWTNQLKFWHGNWHNASNKGKSYVYEWVDADKNHPDYAPNKFADLENSYYIIKDAPFPFETSDLHNRDNGEIAPSVNVEGISIDSCNVPLQAADPHSDSNKLVLKSYVDERLAAKRLIEVLPEFRVRDYDCTYIVRAKDLQEAEAAANGPIAIRIHYPSQFEDRLKHNNLEFKLLLEGVESDDGGYKPALTNNVTWHMYDSTGDKLEIRWLNKSDKSLVNIPNVAEERFYQNARHMLFAFRTVTNSISNHDRLEVVDGKIEKVGEYTTPNYSVYALCENMIYHNKQCIDSINGITNVQNIEITSEDETIIVRPSKVEGSAIIDLSANINERDYFIVSPDESIEVSTFSTDKSTTFNLKAIPSQTIEIVSSETVNVTENKIGNITYYSFTVKAVKLHNTDGYIKITSRDNDGYNWYIDSNLRYEEGPGIKLTEHTRPLYGDDSEETIKVLEIASNITVEAGDNITVNKEGDKFIINGTFETTANNIFLKPSDGNIYFDASNVDNFYITNFNELVINDSALKDDEIGSLTVYINTKGKTEDTELNAENITWTMNNASPYPRLKPDRLYSITFTSVSDVILGLQNSRSIYGKVNWFRNI